jgi:hypothetical protein
MSQTDATNETDVVKPEIGGLVFFYPAVSDEAARNNHAKVIPAIVVNTNGDNPNFSLNLHAFPDGPLSLWRTSVPHQSKASEGQSYWLGDEEWIEDVEELNTDEMKSGEGSDKQPAA